MAKSKSLYCLSGRLGVTEGFQENNTNMVTEDADGEIPDGTYNWLVDIPMILSKQLGKQMSSMATYRVKGIHLSLRNVNNTVDNDASLQMGGVVRWYSPTKHRIDALQHARDYKRQIGAVLAKDADATDPFSFFTDDKHYKGMRFNWNADAQLDENQMPDNTGILTGSYWALDEIFDHYNKAISGTPAEEGRPTTGPGSAMWTSRTGVDQFDSLYWNAAYTNRIQTSGFSDDGEHHAPSFQCWDFSAGDSNHLPVLGGLLRFIGVHSNTDTAGILQDEYYIQCSIMLEGWEEF